MGDKKGWGLGFGDLGLGKRVRNVWYKVLSRSDGLAAVYGSCASDLRVNKKISQGGRVSTDIANDPRRNIDTGEYCRRKHKGDQKRLCAISQYSSRVNRGTFNFLDASHEDRIGSKARHRPSLRKLRRNWSHANRTSPQPDMNLPTLIPNPYSLIPLRNVVLL